MSRATACAASSPSSKAARLSDPAPAGIVFRHFSETVPFGTALLAARGQCRLVNGEKPPTKETDVTRKTTHDAKSAELLSDQDLDQVHGGLFGDDVGVLRTGKVVGGQEGEPLTDAGKTGSVMADDVVINWKSR
jgi:hypothetical protein